MFKRFSDKINISFLLFKQFLISNIDSLYSSFNGDFKFLSLHLDYLPS